MKVYKLTKEDLQGSNWQTVFTEFDNDTAVIKTFLRTARKQLNLSNHDDLDTQLKSMSKHINSHLEFNSSGLIKLI